MHLSRRTVILIAIALVSANIFLWSNLPNGNAQQPPLHWAIEKILEIWDKIQEFHLHPPDKTPEAVVACVQKILQGGVSGCLNDRFSRYHTAGEMNEVKIASDGAFGGVGLQLESVNNQAVIMAPLDGTPAERAGIFRTDDVVVEVDGQDVRKETLESIVNKIRGPEKSQVTIRVQRDGVLRDAITLTREIIILQSIKAIDIDRDSLYLRISGYTQQTMRQFLEAQIQRMMSITPRKNVIYDVRDNPGGSLDVVAHMCGVFADSPADLLVMIKSRSDELFFTPASMRMPAEFIGIFSKTYPINAAVLMNGGSASASEIFAACAREKIGALLVGEHSFGKGSVQTIIPLPDGDGLRLTTHEYFVGPQYVAINRIGGLTPDYAIKPGLRADGSLIPFTRGDPNEDIQLKEAIRLLRKRTK